MTLFFVGHYKSAIYISFLPAIAIWWACMNLLNDRVEFLLKDDNSETIGPVPKQKPLGFKTLLLTL